MRDRLLLEDAPQTWGEVSDRLGVPVPVLVRWGLARTSSPLLIKLLVARWNRAARFHQISLDLQGQAHHVYLINDLPVATALPIPEGVCAADEVLSHSDLRSVSIA